MFIFLNYNFNEDHSKLTVRNSTDISYILYTSGTTGTQRYARDVGGYAVALAS